jgi:hypothetical protein
MKDEWSGSRQLAVEAVGNLIAFCSSFLTMETMRPICFNRSPQQTPKEVRMKSQRNIARQLFGLTLTLVGLMSWNPLPATEYQLRFSNIVTRSNNDCV